MNATPLLDTFVTLFTFGLLLSIGTLVGILLAPPQERSTLPRAVARLP